MLPEWYFCCCIDATPETTKAFLSTLETIDNPAANDRLLYLAFDELQQMDVWMRAYALPQVLAWRRGRELSDNLHRQSKSYLEELLGRMPEDYEESFANLIDLVTARVGSQQKLSKALERCAKSIVSSPRRDVSSTPYIDLREFLPETFLLAVLATESGHQKAFAAEMATALVEDSSLKEIFRGALDHRFGRLAFRLAVRIAVLVPTGDSQRGLITRIRKTESPAIEPDLLQSVAEIVFLYDLARDSSLNKATICGKIHLETLLLSYLRDLIRGRQIRNTLPLKRIDLELIGPRETVLPIIYWQATLWDLMLQLDPECAADRLAVSWRPLSETPASPIKLKGPFTPEVAKTWRRQLSSLLSLQGLGRVDLATSKGQSLSVEPAQECLFLSPWVRRRTSGTVWQKDVRYPNAANIPEVVIRLVAAVAVSTRLLQVLPEANKNRAAFAAMIAHGHDVFDMFRFWLLNHGKSAEALKNVTERDAKKPRLVFPLTALTLFGRRQTTLVGTGRLESVPPDLFMGLLRSNQSMEGRSRAESEFYETVLPEVIIAWVGDAYTSAIESGGSRRWLKPGTIPEVYSYFRKTKHDRDEIIGASLVPRFLCPGIPLDLPRQLKWQTAETEKYGALKWRVKARQLLLTEQGLSPDEWDRPEWDTPDWRGKERGYRAAVLVRDLERLASLKYLGGISESKKDEWRQNWMTLLNSVIKSEELDRYIRLRLLELLDDPVLEDSLDGQELIALVLLEYGSTYELMKLFENVFKSRDGKLTDTSEIRAQLQESLLRAVCRDSRREVSARAKQHGPQDPRRTLIDYQRAILIQDWLTRISFLILASQEQRHAVELGEILAELMQKPLANLAHVEMHSIKGEVELNEDEKKIIWQQENVTIHNWTVHAAAYNPNQLTMSILFDDYDLTGVDDLFNDPELSDQYLEKQTHYVLAVLMSNESLSDGRIKYVFNCGLGTPLHLVPNNGNTLPINQGGYVALPIQRRKNLRNELYWQIQDREGSSVRPLPTRIWPGEVKEVSVKEYSRESSPLAQPARYLIVRRGKEQLENKIDLKLWDADVSRCFHRFATPYENKVYARYGEDGKWRPIDHTFADLLLLATQNKQHSVTLTFIEEAEGLFGEPAWRFSAQPGDNYLLAQSMFVSDDAQLLRQKIEDLEDGPRSFGLLLTVRPSENNGQILLSLVSRLPDNWADPFHESLQAPFDYRNIEWRELFHQQDNPIADIDDETGNWYYEVEGDVAAGYPSRVRVDWKIWPQTEDFSAEFKVTGWTNRHFRNAVVEGEYPGQNEIPLKDESLKSFIRWWPNLVSQKGTRIDDTVRLHRPLGRISPEGRGYVSCKTEENLIVSVEVESLTMLPINPGEYPPVKDRTAEVINIWTDAPVELALDARDIPDEVLEEDSCKGVLLRVPTRTSGNVCKVAWVTPDGPLEQDDLRIENLKELRISQGCIIEGRLRASEWKFVAIQPRVRVRALWSKRKWEPGMAGLTYLDTYFSHSTRTSITIAQLRPGQLVEIDHKLEEARHLATGDGNIFSGGLKPEMPVKNVGPEQSGRSRAYQRVVLSIGRQLLIGECASGMLGGSLAVTHVRVKTFDKGDGLFGLRREFVLRRVYSTQLRREEKSERDLTEVWKALLEKYLADPTDVLAVFERKRGEAGARIIESDPSRSLRVPAGEGEITWTSWVQLAADEGVFVVGQPYPPEEAIIRLFEAGGNRILASFRRVPPLTPELYKARVGVNFFDDAPLGERLYYVGPEDSDQITGEEYDETCHRFELGYGRTLLVPESRLLFKGSKFGRKAQLVMFHGDAVSRIRFMPNTSSSASDPDQAEMELAEGCIIDITEIQLSLAHSIYSQRADHGIVHILHLVCYENYMEIKSVEGFNENHLAHKIHTFEPRQARLTEESEDRLLRRLVNIEGSLPHELLILGRLNQDLFESNYGKDLIFEHVRLSFEDSPLGPPLIENEMVFLEAGDIIDRLNDVSLLLYAPTYSEQRGFSPEDVGEDFYDDRGRSHVLLSRRRFSIRENLLKRIKDQNGARSLEGSFLLVRLSKRRSSVLASLMEKAPTRKETALVGKIARGEVILAVVMRVMEKSIRVEIAPGIFVNIGNDQIESLPENLEKGAVIRIENVDSRNASGFKFRISSAAFADAHYVPSYTRPAVLLPMNNMLSESVWESGERDSDQFWQGKESFTIGGLPNIIASPGRYDRDTGAWHAPRALEFVKLMETRHPKFVRLGQDRWNRFRVAPLPEDFPVGSILVKDSSLEVEFNPITSEGEGVFSSKPLNWSLLSFMEESARQIIQRAKMEPWQYHDSKTGTWTNTGQINWEETGRHDVWRGPLFFEARDNELRLRYSQAEFPKFGFPVEELINSLTRKHNRTHIYTVAGVSDTETGGLWVELSPGRIAELPANRVIMWTRAGMEKSLASMCWANFAPGDRITLGMDSSDPFTIDRIILKDWRPGLRKAFGPQRTYLPVSGHDVENGGLILGKGLFKLNFPVARADEGVRAVILNPDNHLEDITNDSEKMWPEPGDTVLLGIDDEGRPAILGLKGLAPIPDRHDVGQWRSDPLAEWIISPQKNFVSLLEIFGGALPVTVEGVNRQTRKLYYSLRHQQVAAVIPSGKIALTRLVGLLPDKRTAVMRCGSGFFTSKMDQVISGLPESFFSAVAHFLIESQEPIWVRGKEDGRHVMGVSNESSKELIAESIGVVSLNGTAADAGLICRDLDSQILYWMPKARAAWAALTTEQYRRFFPQHKTFRAVLIEAKPKTPSISLVDLRKVQKEFEEMTIGKELSVRILEQVSGESDSSFHYLAESTATNVILSCVTYGEPLTDENVRVEVVRRKTSLPRSILVVPLGKKPQKLDVPEWMYNDLPNPLQRRDVLKNYLSWRTSPQPLSEFLDVHISKDTEDGVIERILCYAYDSPALNPGYLDLRIRASREWLQRIESRPEIYLPYAIIAVLLLHNSSQMSVPELSRNLGVGDQTTLESLRKKWRREARMAVQGLGRRSLRSSHAEVLAQEWLLDADKRIRDDGLWQRLQKTAQYMHWPVKAESLDAIRQFCYAVELRDKDDLKVIAGGLMSTLGEVPTMLNPYFGASVVTQDLIRIYRTLPQAKRPLRLQESHIKKLREILVRITNNALDITLLDPFPLL
jgi:hypothetical protein